jgi:sporulation protein YlmC with PRC-barrel domain
MFRKAILCALASAAMIPAAAFAQHGGGGGHGSGGPPAGGGPGMGNGGVGGGMGNAGGPGGGMGNAGGLGGAMGNAGLGGLGGTARDQARMNSQGPANASPTGIAHANSNSVLSGASSTSTSAGLDRMFPGTRTTTNVASGSFAGLTTGMTLMSNGTAVGTVQQIRTTGTGSVAVVIVRGTNGGLFAVPANKLMLSGGTLSTTARFAGINTSTTMAASSNARLNSQSLMHASPTGIAHASSRSVLAGGTVVRGSLAGLTTGLTVNTSTGTTLGRVSQIVTGANGSVRLVIVTSSTGRMLRLSPATLSISGGTVTTTQTMASSR